MNNKEIQQAVQAAKKNSVKRNFKQTVDLIVNLKGLNLKKPDHQVDVFIQLHNPRAKKAKICGLVGPELADQSKAAFDNTILVDDFAKFTKKSEIKKLARQFDFFVAQGNMMAKVAQTFGRYFGPVGKMPNPKGGCVVPPNANLTQVAERLQMTLRLRVKTHLAMQAAIGLEDTDEAVVIDNAKVVYDQLVHSLPQEQNNIKNVMIKLTMGKPVTIGKPESKKEEATPEVKKKVTKEPKVAKPKKVEPKEAVPEEK